MTDRVETIKNKIGELLQQEQVTRLSYAADRIKLHQIRASVEELEDTNLILQKEIGVLEVGELEEEQIGEELARQKTSNHTPPKEALRVKEEQQKVEIHKYIQNQKYLQK